jgi:hypothetical protein
MATPAEEIRAESYVGFDSITQQIEHKLLKRGFQFNVILVGAFCISSLIVCLAAHFFFWCLLSPCFFSLFFFIENLKAKLDWESRRSSTPFLRRT